jgi:hypothetical protein
MDLGYELLATGFSSMTAVELVQRRQDWCHGGLTGEITAAGLSALRQGERPDDRRWPIS